MGGGQQLLKTADDPRLARHPLRALQRITTTGTVLPVVDGLRFVAIAAVVLYHLQGYGGEVVQHGPVWRLAKVGWFGVELFFAISGFVLGLGFIRSRLGTAPPVRMGAYLWRRVTRLEPPYVVALLVYFGLKTFIAGEDGLLPHLFASAAYVHNVAYGEPSRVLGIAWSLEIEVQFYLLVPFLSLVFTLRSASVRRALLLAGIAGGQLLAAAVHSTPPSILGHLHWFLVGFLLCDLHWVDWRSRGSSRWPLAWDLTGALAWVGMFCALAYPPDFRWTLPWLMAIAYSAAFRGRWMNALLRSPTVWLIGGTCYSVYLYHTVILRLLVLDRPLVTLIGEHVPAAWRLPVLALCALPVVFVLTSAAYLLIERPCMQRDWPQRLWARIRGVA